MTGIVMGVNGGSSGTDVSDTTATTADVRQSKYFYLANGTKTSGTMAEKAAATLTPSSSADGVISKDQYLTGDQTLPKDANFVPENIKGGVSIWGKTGTFNDKTLHVYDDPRAASSTEISNSVAVADGFVPIIIVGVCQATISSTSQVSMFTFHDDGSALSDSDLSKYGVYYNAGCDQEIVVADLTSISITGTTLSYTITAHSGFTFSNGSTYNIVFLGYSQ